MNQKAKDYIRRNTLDLESDNRMDSTGYVQYAISNDLGTLFWKYVFQVYLLGKINGKAIS